jgi:uncharacterized membrane protein
MNTTAVLLALGIGIVAGLRAMTAPAVVAWAACLLWINLTGSPLAFMGSKWAVALFTIAALGELVNDQLPKTPARTAAGPFAARIAMGALTGACLAIAANASLLLGALLGVVGALIGTLGGYKTRVGLVSRLGVPDFAIAIPEDLVAIGLAVLLVRRG